MISIIIPFRDKTELLRRCVFSILEKTAYQDYEILLVDNQSTEKETKVFLDEIENNGKIKILNYDNSFNFSAINNFAVNHASGEYVLFLNNDTEVISADWLDEMLGCFEDDKVGVAGAKLLYPNNSIQHCGVMLEEKRLAVHAFRTWKESDIEIEGKKEWAAVTGACMLTKKELFLKVGGFDEINLPIAYNDVDYCLKVGKLGYNVVCVSNVKLYHYESATRKSDVKIFYKFLKQLSFLKFKKLERYSQFLQEQKYMRNKWKKEISTDLFYNEKFL